MLQYLPFSLVTNRPFTSLQHRQIYFGNWLRDFSQAMDTTCLQAVTELILRAIVSAMRFMEFGFTSDEFDVTHDRLGVYTHVENIDNPEGYAEYAQKIDERLRGPVDSRELDIGEGVSPRGRQDCPIPTLSSSGMGRRDLTKQSAGVSLSNEMDEKSAKVRAD